jgi:hypothetical protein
MKEGRQFEVNIPAIASLFTDKGNGLEPLVTSRRVSHLADGLYRTISEWSAESMNLNNRKRKGMIDSTHTRS